MHIVLLSGGSGKRLWPLSNDIRSKQFIPLFPQVDGSYLSMAQRVFRQICKADKAEKKFHIYLARSCALCYTIRVMDAGRLFPRHFV